ncbi:hypothetical protein B0A55_11080, partial [Friedmanniomyces simplex]
AMQKSWLSDDNIEQRIYELYFYDWNETVDYDLQQDVAELIGESDLPAMVEQTDAEEAKLMGHPTTCKHKCRDREHCKHLCCKPSHKKKAAGIEEPDRPTIKFSRPGTAISELYFYDSNETVDYDLQQDVAELIRESNLPAMVEQTDAEEAKLMGHPTTCKHKCRDREHCKHLCCKPSHKKKAAGNLDQLQTPVGSSMVK